MKFAGEVVKHLGLQMYSGSVPAIAELISNAWDANAENVQVDIDFGQPISPTNTITVSDDGHGMEWEDCDSKYMIIGRDARKEDGDVTKGKFKRPRMAHKGLGKLAGFGIAETVEIITVKDKKRTSFVLDYSAIEKLEHGQDYKIMPKEDNVPTEDHGGTTVILRNLKLKRAIPEEQFMRGMARRFSVLSDTFKITINKTLLKKDAGPFQIRFPQAGKEEFEILGAGIVKLWIGFTKKPIHSVESQGIAVLARGKLVQEPWLFGVSGGTSGQHGMQYMTGEVEADFLDEKTDYVTSGRNSVMWSMDVPSLLQEWGKKKVTDVLAKWSDERGRINIERNEHVVPYMDRINRFPTSQKKELTSVARKMAAEIVEPERLADLIRSLINAYENKELTRMIDEVSSLSPDAQTKLLEILQEFQVLESVLLAQIVKSRIRIIDKFGEMIRKGVPEKPDMQDYLRDHPWLISPQYGALTHEKQLDTILKDHFGETTERKEKNRRVDFFCLTELGRAFVIEVKRPQETIGRKGIRQLADYVDFLRQENENVSDPLKKKTFFGYLIGSDYSDDTKGERERAKHDGIYTETWDTLLDTAKRSHQQYYDAMRKNIPEDNANMDNFDSR